MTFAEKFKALPTEEKLATMQALLKWANKTAKKYAKAKNRYIKKGNQ